MSHELPHDPYITAVTDALTAAGLEPTECWTEDNELDRYRDDDLAGVAVMLTAVLEWDGGHPAVDTGVAPYGVVLLWEHPAERWQWARRERDGRLEREPEILPTLGRYTDPAAVVTVVRALLAGESLPQGHAPYWHQADSVRRAVDAWAAAETSQ
ncbi:MULTISPECIES: hypothetical protein [Streptomyces]|uniref:hypothetical protein n=1 Tax=Streptomyces TaxID=1883 RepID=UPI001679AC58|nr:MULTISPECIES: hypothetical protein [Streptomyces]MBK3524859.1 hypothetical protein [Streptomyces sp. MBT70]GGR70878.1 hypothetical protein GCM10010236_26400 [Streptomyces eurythermus]